MQKNFTLSVLNIIQPFFHMTKYTQKFKLDLIQEYLDTGCSQRCLENKYSLPKDTLKNGGLYTI